MIYEPSEHQEIRELAKLYNCSERKMINIFYDTIKNGYISFYRLVNVFKELGKIFNNIEELKFASRYIIVITQKGKRTPLLINSLIKILNKHKEKK